MKPDYHLTRAMADYTNAPRDDKCIYNGHLTQPQKLRMLRVLKAAKRILDKRGTTNLIINPRK